MKNRSSKCEKAAGKRAETRKEEGFTSHIDITKRPKAAISFSKSNHECS
jgi:hypothetical protein